jgi:hypothetical protein
LINKGRKLEANPSENSANDFADNIKRTKDEIDKLIVDTNNYIINRICMSKNSIRVFKEVEDIIKDLKTLKNTVEQIALYYG